jgi:hypothetical protein
MARWNIAGPLAAVIALCAAADANAQDPCSAQRAFLGHHVLFGHAAKKPVNDGVVRVYFDRLGALYPTGEVAPRDADIGSAATLGCYYARNAAAFEHLRRETRVNVPKFTDAWEDVQDTLTGRIATDLNRRLLNADGTTRTLLVLIHGFRVDDATEPFDSARAAVLRLLPRNDVVFLEVNWDGLSGLPSVWFSARTNAPLVGLALRRILGNLTPGTPIRVLTHSLGASVAASALWNRHRDLDRRDGALRRYFENVGGNRRFPLRRDGDIRIGMFVPAVPGQAMPEPSLRPLPLTRMIVGQNANDMAVQKVIRVAKVGGSTALAVDDREYCTYVGQVFGGGAILFDFKRSARPAFLATESHDFRRYVREGTELLQDLLSEKSTRSQQAETHRGGHAKGITCEAPRSTKLPA